MGTNWKGGRVLGTNGYMLVWVGKGHHLADSKGYAYEHRVVAERMLGRRLTEGEEVHHGPGGKQDNRPENLEVLTIAEHHKVHRFSGRRLRDPGEPNPDVACKCGCGTMFSQFDYQGRLREYASGHNPQHSPVLDLVLSAVRGGETSTAGIIKSTGVNPRLLNSVLSRLKKRGAIIHSGYGRWAYNGD